MLWGDLLELATDQIAETVSDTGYFQKTYNLKLYAASVQNYATRLIKCLEHEDSHSIALTAAIAYYSLPADFIQFTAAKYIDLNFLIPRDKRPMVVAYPSGSPREIWVEGKKFGLYPAPDTVGPLYVWYKRVEPTYAFSLQDTNANSTVCTLSVTTTKLTFTITSGPNAGAYDVDWATYPTIESVVLRINSLAKGVVAVKNAQCDDARLPSDLEVVTGIKIKDTTASPVLNRVTAAFLNPVIPDEYQVPILVEAMIEQAKKKDREYQIALEHRANWMGAIKEARATWQDRKTGIYPQRITSGYAGSFIENVTKVT